MLTRLDSFTRKHVILMELYTSSFIPRPPTWPGMRLTHLLGNLQVDAGYLRLQFHANIVHSTETTFSKGRLTQTVWHGGSETKRAIFACVLPWKTKCAWCSNGTAICGTKLLRERFPVSNVIRHTQLVALFPPSFTSSLQYEKKWDWGRFLFLSWACR